MAIARRQRAHQMFLGLTVERWIHGPKMKTYAACGPAFVEVLSPDRNPCRQSYSREDVGAVVPAGFFITCEGAKNEKQ